MAKLKLKAYTFNGSEIYPNVEVFISLGKDKNNYPTNVYHTLKEKIKQELKIEPKFYIISKDIDKLRQNNIKLDYNDFIEKVYNLLVEELQDYKEEISNPLLKRALHLKEEKKDFLDILNEIDNNSLSKYELEEYNLLKFFVSKNKDEEFEMYKTFFTQNLLKLKELYFIYIKDLEDRREFYKSSKLIKEFQNIFPIDELNDEEKAIYYYLIGRNYYQRGEFLLALENLSLAKEYVKDNKKLLADIYNSATNSFTDNLFFDEALEIANKALKIRESLHLPQKYETISLIGGIYFKDSKYKLAYNHYKKALEGIEDSRIYNYLAKSAIMLKYKNSIEYIKKSEQYEDKQGFLVFIKILYAFYNNIDEVIEIYNKEFIEKNRYFEDVVKAWSNTFVACTYFQKENYETGIKYLYKALKNFINDKYILEAYYVSLYIFVYDIPEKYINDFEYLKESLELDKLIDEYIIKHKNIAKEYAEKFDIKLSNKNNLLSFYEKSKNKIDLKNLIKQFSLF